MGKANDAGSDVHADKSATTWDIRPLQARAPYAIHFQQPGSPVRYEPGHEDELTLLGQPF